MGRKKIENATFAPIKPVFDGADMRTYKKDAPAKAENNAVGISGGANESLPEIRRKLVEYLTERDKLTEALEGAQNAEERSAIEGRINELERQHIETLRSIKQFNTYEIS